MGIAKFEQAICGKILQQGWGLKFTDAVFGIKTYNQDEIREEHSWYTEEHEGDK